MFELISDFNFLAFLTMDLALFSLFNSFPNINTSEQISSKVVPFNEIIFVDEDRTHLLFFKVASILFLEIAQTSHKP